jgi:hypothetical protein
MNLIKQIAMRAERLNFDWDVTGLGAYVDDNSDELFRRAVTVGRTLGLIRIQEDVKGSARIKLLNDAITYQAADDCSMTANNNDTVLTDKTITSVKQGFLKTYCQDDLSGFWTRLALKGGAMAENEELIFEQELMEYILELHASKLDTEIWQGDTSGTDLFDGFGTKLDADAAVIQANPGTVTAMTAANAYAQFLAVARALPEEIAEKEDVRIFCSLAYFNLLKDDLFSQNLYHVPVADEQNNTMILPATGIRIEQVSGLSGSTGMYAGRSQDFIFGTALESDAGSVEMWYDKTTDLIYVRTKFYAGVEYPFSNQIVKWNPSAS